MQYTKLLILGGTGKTGKKLLREALSRGYQVTALARDRAALADLDLPNLEIREGDLSDPATADILLAQGFDAVLSTLGIFHKGPGTPLADMTEHLVAAMEKHGPKRLVLMSSLGAGDSAGQGNLVVKFVTGWILRYVLVDKNAQERLLQNSALNWTVLRPPRLLENNHCGDYHLWQGRNRPKGTLWKISNRDAAKEMLNLLEREDASRQAYQCSY